VVLTVLNRIRSPDSLSPSTRWSAVT